MKYVVKNEFPIGAIEHEVHKHGHTIYFGKKSEGDNIRLSFSERITCALYILKIGRSPLICFKNI